jgi:prevent-host-death family protein
MHEHQNQVELTGETSPGRQRRWSQNRYLRNMATIPQKELRNNVGEVLRRAQSGEQITITVSGRPVAQLGPIRGRRWVDSTDFAELCDLPADDTLARDLEGFGSGLRDPSAQ